MVPLCPSDPVVLVVDDMEFRRARVVRFLMDWAAQEKVSLLSLSFEQAHRELRDRANECRMVVLNVGAASCSGSEVLSEIKVIQTLAPTALLAIVTDEENPEDVVAAMQAGTDAYISEHSDPDMALRALSFVLHGGTYFPRSVVDHPPFPSESSVTATTAWRGATPEIDMAATESTEGTFGDVSGMDNLATLTVRQRAILDGLCRGEPNKIIGRRLDLPESTVKVHVREIMRKFAVSNRTQVALAVSRFGAGTDTALDSSNPRDQRVVNRIASQSRCALHPEAISAPVCRIPTDSKKPANTGDICPPAPGQTTDLAGSRSSKA
jgi:DNA-binding NarL/FixJ family response regulator